MLDNRLYYVFNKVDLVDQARASALRALELTRNRAEQSLLSRRLLEW